LIALTENKRFLEKKLAAPEEADPS
jgi:hypothetical protein